MCEAEPVDAISSLEALAQVSVTLAGFSGLVVAFRAGSASSLETWLPRERLVFWMLVASGFSALFFSLLPLALLALALDPESVWRISSLALFAFIASALVGALLVNRRLTQAGHPSVIPRVWAVGASLALFAAMLELANALGGFASRAFGVYFLGLLLLLGMGCLTFVVFLLYPGRRSDRPGDA